MIKSRRKAVFVFLTYSFLLLLIYLYLIAGISSTTLYIIVSILGFGMGYWAVFVTIAAE